MPVLVKEEEAEYAVNRFTDPQSIAKMVKTVFRLHKQAEEHMYLLCFTTKGELLGVFELSHGNVSGTYCGIREIFLKALSVGATGMVLVHNHPSGDCTPSALDLKTTKNVREAGKLMQIPLLDHIIVGDSYVSLREKGDF